MNPLPYYPLPLWLRRALPFLLTVLVTLSLIVGLTYAGARLTDFSGYYTAGRMLLEGHDPADLYDDIALQNAMRTYGIQEPTIVMYVNPPTVALVAMTVAGLDPFPAKLLWNLAGMVCVMASWWILGRTLSIPAGTGYPTLLLLLIAGTLPFLRNLQLGQMYPLVLLLFSVLLHSYRFRRIPGTALSLAALILLKYYGWLFLVLFILQRRWKEFWWSVLATGAGLALCFWYFGVEACAMPMERVLGMAGQVDTASVALRSIVAPLSKLFVFHEAWNPAAVAHLPIIPSVTPWILLVAALWVTARRQPVNDIVLISIFLVLSVLFTPLAADHHYILLTIPAFVLIASMAWSPPDLRNQWLPVLSLFLLLGWVPQIPAQFLDGWNSLFAYSRVYAAVALWVFLLRIPAPTRAGRQAPALS